MLFKLNLKNYFLIKKKNFIKNYKYEIKNLPKIYFKDPLVKLLKKEFENLEIGDIIKIIRENNSYTYREIINE